MKCEGFSMVSNLVDYLNNNLLIAHYCGFDISRPLPSYWSFDRFLKHFGQDALSRIMQRQVLSLTSLGVIDISDAHVYGSFLDTKIIIEAMEKLKRKNNKSSFLCLNSFKGYI